MGATDAGSTGGGSTGEPTTEPTTGGAALLPGECESPIEPVLLTSARLSVDAGGRLRDEHGRDVQLRGVNTGGRSKWAPFVPFPIDAEAELPAVQAAADEFFARLPPWGINVVRMPFSWEGVEPIEGMYDQRYLDRYAAMVEAAWGRGIRVVVDFHQDVYASPFCGDGFPPWTLPGEPGPPRRDCPDWGLKYVIDNEVRGAFDRFWADEGGIQAKFFAMWGQMIERIGDHPGVVALEIVNEPGWGTAQDITEWKEATLNPFHTEAVAELRARAGDELLIVYNNPGVEALDLQPMVHMRPEGEGIMYGPHLYDPGLIQGDPGIGMMPEVLLGQFAEFSAEAGVAVLVGEFGIGAGAPGGPEWLTRALVEIDARRLSATMWECSQSAELWNEEDLSLLAADGSERAAVEIFVRPYLRAVAGTFVAFAWDGATATARWTGDGGVTEIALPQRRFPDVPEDIALKTVSGPDGACFTRDAERGELRVKAPAGAEIEVTIGG
jgi:endoglycosylceramidase